MGWKRTDNGRGLTRMCGEMGSGRGMFRALQGRGLWTEESRMMRWNQAQQPVEGFWGTSLVGGPPDKLQFKSKIAQPIDSDSD